MASDYVHTNIDDIEDLAPKYGMEFGEARVIHAALGTEQAGASYYRMAPGKRFGFGHRHTDAEEIYLVLEGSGRVKLDDEIRDLARLDVLHCPPAVMREFEGGPEGMTLLAVGQHLKGDGEMVPGWWTD
ncbi:MAG: cupin domain-containing protein [Patulibacter minatonensis]